MSGPPGHFPAGAFLNDAMKEAVSKRNLPEVVEMFAHALKGLEAHHFNHVVHRNKAHSPV